MRVTGFHPICGVQGMAYSLTIAVLNALRQCPEARIAIRSQSGIAMVAPSAVAPQKEDADRTTCAEWEIGKPEG